MPLRYNNTPSAFLSLSSLNQKDSELCDNSEVNVFGELCSLCIPLGDAHPHPQCAGIRRWGSGK